MINKQSLWFITLFSLILILGIYYVSLPSTSLAVFEDSNIDNSQVVEVTESDVIVALKVQEEEKILEEMQKNQEILLDSTSTMSQKNEAYETLQLLNSKKGKTLEIEKKIKENFNVSSSVSIDGNKIFVTLDCKDQGNEYANNVIKLVQSLYNESIYVTVKFQ